MSKSPPPLPSIHRMVERVIQQARNTKIFQGRTIGFLIGIILFFILVYTFDWGRIPSLLIGVGSGLMLGSILGRGFPSAREIIANIGETKPNLRYLLATANEQEVKLEAGQDVSYLEQQVIAQAVNEALAEKIETEHLLPRLKKARLFSWLAFAALIGASLISLSPIGNSTTDPTVAQSENDDESNIEIGLGLIVKPGNTEVEKETRLVVLAEFIEELPESAVLVMESKDGEHVKRVPMKKQLNDPEFAATIESVPGDGIYRIEVDGKTSQDYEIKTYERPRLVQSDANVVPPEGSDRANQLTEDTRRARVFQGDKVEWKLEFNKPVSEAKLVAKDGHEIPLKPNPENPNEYSAEMAPQKSDRYELLVKDDEGRENSNPPQLSVLVKENRPVLVKLNFPTLDTRVTPIQEITPEATFTDDLGIKEAGATFRFGGNVEEVNFDLATSDLPKKQRFQLPLDFETLKARPNQLLTYFFWAEDQGPDAKPRRIESDMYFIEVRHFEEIYREAEGNAKFPKGNSTCKKILQYQKRLINATWKTQRSRPDDKTLAKDGLSLWKMQEYIIAELDIIIMNSKDPVFISILQDAQEAMREAQAELQKVEKLDFAAIDPALENEQQGYERLMNALSREYRMMKSLEPSPGAPKPPQPKMRLKFTQKDRRYESERMAEAEEEKMSEELMAHFKRMLDLSQRQKSITEAIDHLLLALETAETTEEKEEIERELKRLREEQRALLAEIDQLLEKFDESADFDNYVEAREELEKARSRAQQASQALQEKDLEKARSASKRAEEEIAKATEELRENTASQFAKAMEDLKAKADQLDESQSELTEALSKQSHRGTAPKRTRDNHEKSLKSQQEKLEALLEKMKETTVASEEQEPLLSRKLYEAVRAAETHGTSENLEEAAKEVRKGKYAKASEMESQAAENIRQLKQRIDNAAEAVLGSETEALKLADRKLTNLIDDLNKEMPASEQARREKEAEGKKPGNGDKSGKGDSKMAKAGQKGSQPGEGEKAGEGDSKGRGKGQSEMAKAGQKGSQPGEGEKSGKGESKGKGKGQSEMAKAGQKGSQPGDGEKSGKGESKGKGKGDSEGESTEQLASAEGSGKGKGRNRSNGSNQPNQLDPQPQEETTGEGRPGNNHLTKLHQGNSLNHGGTNQLHVPSGQATPSFLDAFDTESQSKPDLPITGDDFKRWSELLKDVETMLGDPDKRREAAKVRLRAREFRSDYKQHSKAPEWNLVDMQLIEPLKKLRTEVQEDIARREGSDKQVRVDRDPAPEEFREMVGTYFERLSESGE